jgi:hypothetical protein
MRKLVPALLISALALLFLTLWPVHVLSLRKEGRLLFMERIRAGNVFSLTYLHSVEKSDVEEWFVIDSEYRIVLRETRFQGQGAGLPSNLVPGERLTREGPWFRVVGMTRVLPVIQLRVDPQWHNRFRFEQKEEKNLSSLMGSSLILIQVEEANLWSWLRYQIWEATTNNGGCR